MLFFSFTEIRTHSTENIGVGTPLLRGASLPEIFFYILDSGWLSAFIRTLPWLDFVVFGRYPWS